MESKFLAWAKILKLIMKPSIIQTYETCIEHIAIVTTGQAIIFVKENFTRARKAHKEYKKVMKSRSSLDTLSELWDGIVLLF